MNCCESVLCLVVAAVAVLNVAEVQGGNLFLDFNRDTLGKPPQSGTASGAVSVVHHVMKAEGDRCVALAWEEKADAPELSLTAEDRKLPLRGVLRFDLLIERTGGQFEVLGLSNRGMVMFRFLIDDGGRAWTVGTDGLRNQILCVSAPPDKNHWYEMRLQYDLTARKFNVVLDKWWESGDSSTPQIDSEGTLDRIVFRCQGPGAAYYLDTVRLVAPDGDLVGSDGTTLPLGCSSRKICFDTPLLADPAPLSAIIVYPSGMVGSEALGQRVRQAVRARGGRDIPCVSDEVVVDQATWLVREEFLGRPIIALGNATDNKVLYALATRFLTRSNRKWPGEDRHCTRSVLEPFRADMNWIVVEASTSAGLSAGVEVLCRRITEAPTTDLAIPYFRELGAAKGPWKGTPFKVSGLDLSKPIEDIKEQIKRQYGPSARIVPGEPLYYGDAAWAWLEGADQAAAKFAAAVLLMEMERDPYRLPVGHYNYDRCIKAWQICFTSGVMDEALINRGEAAMARNAANPYTANDWFAEQIRSDRGRVFSYFTDRHWTATAANFICGTEYVLSHCRLNPVTRSIAEDYHQAYLMSARRLTDMFRPRAETTELGDVNAMVVSLMAHSGNMTYVRNGTLARAAEVYLALCNNLGGYVTEGGYIGRNLTARLPGKNVIGAAAFYTGDPEFQWLRRHLVGTEWSEQAQTNPVFDDDRPERFPQRYVGLHVVPFDPNTYRALVLPGVIPLEWHKMFARPLETPIESLFSLATFRDGFTPETAFLTLYGVQPTGVQLANTIPQYTDLGQTLLFTGTRLLDRWSRNAALASNGRPCQPAVACILKASLSSPVVSAVSSTDPFNGNTEATRTIVHRAGHYFVVFDSFKAHAEDDYTLLAQWRSPNPAALEGNVWTAQAPEGVTFRIQSADTVDAEGVHADFDGDYRPFILRQRKQVRLHAAQTATIRNVLYASSEARPDQCEARAADDNCLLVQGKGKDWSETALIGQNSSPISMKDIEIKADVFYLSGSDLVAANATRVKIGGKSLMDGSGPTNVVLKLNDPRLAARLEKAFSAAAAAEVPTKSPAGKHGLRELWKATDPVPAREQYRILSAAADRAPWTSGGPDMIIDPTRIVVVATPQNAVSWKSDQGPVTLTFDLGEVKDIGAVRLIGTIVPGYVRKFAWGDGDLKAQLSFSDDNFQRDIRVDTSTGARYAEMNRPRVQYIQAASFPQLIVEPSSPCKARYVRVTLTSRTDQITFQKAIIEGTGPEPTMLGQLKAADLDGDGADELLLSTSNNELIAFGADGTKRWSHRLGGEIVAWDAQDLESDKRAEAMVYTSDDACTVFNGDGTKRWRMDFYEYSKIGPEEQWQRGFCPYLFSCLTAWRPDADGKKEVIGWPKISGVVMAMRQGQDKIALTEYRDFGVDAQVVVADSSVLGKEVMAMCGGSLLVKDTEGNTLLHRNMKGPLAGNGDFPVFVAVEAVADSRNRGFLGINPSSVCWAPADPAIEGWDDFSEVPITARLLTDFDGDGQSELILGYKDGFVRIYHLADGQILGKVCAGSPVTGLAPLGSDLMVAANESVRLYGRDLAEKGSLNIRAVSAVALNGHQAMVCVADDSGVIHAVGH